MERSNLQQQQQQRQPMNDRQIGFNLYLANRPESACQNAAQRAGWRAANNAQGYAEATAYLQGVQ